MTLRQALAALDTASLRVLAEGLMHAFVWQSDPGVETVLRLSLAELGRR